VFFVSYMWAELRRRRGRTVLTALGLAIGVGLVIVVSALSTGLDEAQDEVLQPLTGVGTDMSVTRPLRVSGDGEQFTPGGGGNDYIQAANNGIRDEIDCGPGTDRADVDALDVTTGCEDVRR